MNKKIRKLAPYWVCGVLLCIIFAVFVLRLLHWQVQDGEKYLEQANATTFSRVSLEASRGEILDKNGDPLCQNKTTYQVVFRKPYMTDANCNETILSLLTLFQERGEKWNDTLPIVLDEQGNYQFKENSEEAVAFLKGKSFLNVNAYATAETCVAQLCKLYAVDQTAFAKEMLLPLLSVRYNMTLQTFSTAMPYTFAEDISKELVSILEENWQSLPGVTVQVSTERVYPDGTLAPHLLGSVGKLTAEEYEALKEEGYAYNDVVGKSGIEYAFESYLRGEDGTQSVELNQDGTLASYNVTKNPVQGNTVYTTLDSKLQKVANDSLKKNVELAGIGTDCVAGGVVALDVRDFSVLAYSTYPTFDLGKLYTEDNYYTKLASDSTLPLFNRAFDGAFTPGSVFKPAVAAGALEEGAISSTKSITCNHVYTYFAPSYMPTCMGHHGALRVGQALSRSCNVFFYETGRLLGIDGINSYAKSFGLGVPTGIEVGESSGILANPQERADRGGVWQPGDVIQAAIGQSDNSFTPLQLATYCATIANNGTRLKTHVLSKVTDYARETVVTEAAPEVVEEVPVSLANLKTVQNGMRQVCTEGTASGVFGNYGIAVAGKTGTAENPGHSDNTVFIGYAPYDKPEIAVAVVLEYGSTGQYSMAVAKDIFDAYFGVEEKEKEAQAR